MALNSSSDAAFGGNLSLEVERTANNTNATNMEGAEGDEFHYIVFIIVAPTLFGLVTLIGTIGNLLVIYVILSRKKMRTVTNLLLLNLAIADLSFVLICPPFTAYQFAASMWPLGDIACRLMHYLLNVTAYVTVYTLVLISAVRYMTVVHNTQTLRFRTRKKMVLMIIIIWTIFLILNIPIILTHAVNYRYGANNPDCDNLGPNYGRKIYATFFVFAYLLPLMAVAILSLLILRHIRKSKPSTLETKKTKSAGKKKQASRLLILVVVIFALLWLPVHIHLLIAYFGTIPTSKLYMGISLIWNTLAYFNSCVNPIIYSYASKDFRDSFREVVCCVRQGTLKNKRCVDSTLVTRATYNNANGGEMKRLVSAVKDKEVADSSEL